MFYWTLTRSFLSFYFGQSVALWSKNTPDVTLCTPLCSGSRTDKRTHVMRDLGVMIDSQLSFARHVNSIACKCYAAAELRRIKSFRRSLPTDATRTLVNSLVVSKIDYCNCLLAGPPANLIINAQSASLRSW